ncbi:hypothetical protein TNCV_5006201 [Trichonephila clavipes]|uniref:Uncharacterized protein n=1 Tax=Trichonephila clavipes TaxID=2585209 RepID=A0A8X6V8D1_TRICX|nr:hypothetical protein TNCV_5006201 [Trichonephila clavipes]
MGYQRTHLVILSLDQGTILKMAPPSPNYRSVAKSPHVAEQCDVNIQSINHSPNYPINGWILSLDRCNVQRPLLHGGFSMAPGLQRPKYLLNLVCHVPGY